MFVTLRRPSVVTSLSALVALSGLTVPAEASEPSDARAGAREAYAVRAGAGTVETTDRAQVLDAYSSIYLPAYRTAFGWTGGSLETCQPGAPAPAVLEASLSATNFLRDMAGVPPVTADPAKHTLAQHAALIMDANSTLSHYPAPTMRCYTEAGALGARQSNLALGYTGVQALGGYMSDTGAHNTFAGHRKWILDPGVSTVGFGVTPRGHAMHVIGDDYRWNTTRVAVTWPTAGYFPEGLYPGVDEWSRPYRERGTEPERWSYTTYDDTDFDEATVAVTQVAPTAATLPVTIENYSNGHLVFAPARPTLPSEIGGQDVTYRVTIGGLRNGNEVPLPPVSWTTTLIASPFPNTEGTEPHGTEPGDGTGNPDPVTTGKVIVRGTPRAGRRLRAKVTGFAPDPSRVTYRWFRNSRPIRRATASTYVVRRTDRGTRIRVRATVARPGIRRVSVTSTPLRIKRR